MNTQKLLSRKQRKFDVLPIRVGMAQSLNYRSEIDGLRALAVVPIILYHAGVDIFSGGFVGVDVFLVISGFLITTIVSREIAEDRFCIWNFYERRARRILPALIVVVTFCIVGSWVWLSPADLAGFGQSVVSVTFFSSNFLFWQESGYFDTASELKPLLHTWSLAVEEQFYIFFRCFYCCVERYHPKHYMSSCQPFFVPA